MLDLFSICLFVSALVILVGAITKRDAVFETGLILFMLFAILIDLIVIVEYIICYLS